MRTPSPTPRWHLPAAIAWATLLAQAHAATTQLAPSVPDSLGGSAPVAWSLFRVLGALALVFAIFLGGLWLFRNWQRVLVRSGTAPKLAVLEVKSLGQRHALYVVAYEQQRVLLAASPTGVSLLTHLPAAEARPPEGSTDIARPNFSAALLQAVTRQP